MKDTPNGDDLDFGSASEQLGRPGETEREVMVCSVNQFNRGRVSVAEDRLLWRMTYVCVRLRVLKYLLYTWLSNSLFRFGSLAVHSFCSLLSRRHPNSVNRPVAAGVDRIWHFYEFCAVSCDIYLYNSNFFFLSAKRQLICSFGLDSLRLI